MRLFQVLAFSPLFISRVFSQDLQSLFDELGLGGYGQFFAEDNPALFAEISVRNDITIYAVADAAVDAHRAAVKKRTGNNQGSSTSYQTDHKPPKPNKGVPPHRNKRQTGQVQTFYPTSNFETILTYLDDPEFVNLGIGQFALCAKNYAAPLDGGSTSTAIIEFVTGLGDTRHTVRGPFKFKNGVIYEINDFFTLPQPFTATMEHINIAQDFYNVIVSAKRLSVFEKTPAVTVFAPIDGSKTTALGNPEAYILPGALYFTPDLIPGNTIPIGSGNILNITWAPDGGKLVNGRKIVKANIPMSNGIIHFIDGLLFDPKDVTGISVGLGLKHRRAPQGGRA